jgi:hypothetical protein|tara:strand:+ start:555 stop:800 length:246 start_codon:yes stop_codon:yes gene_type:complete
VEEKEKDLVNYPPHYRFEGFELLDVLKAKLDKANMTLYQASLWTQCVQYMFRFDAKGNPLQDLEKARFYLNEIIKEEYKKK